MKFIFAFLLFLISTCAHAQVEVFIKNDVPKEIREHISTELWNMLPDSIVYMEFRDAARVEYWAQKGVASVKLIAALEQELIAVGQEVEFVEQILTNCQAHQEEYRKKLEHVSVLYNNKQTDYVKLEVDRDMWKQKAKSRGNTIGVIAGAAGLLLFGIAIGI